MRKRRRTRFGGGWLVLLLVLSAIHGLSVELIRWFSGVLPQADPQWAVVDDALRQFGLEQSLVAGQGTVQLVRTGASIDSMSLLGPGVAGAPSGSGYYTFDVAGESQATASAMGVDRAHHIVNAYLVGFMPFATDNLWVPLLTLAQRKRYQYDHLQYWGAQDVWQTSAQAFVRTRGDCEDHALALADWLIGLGEDARVVVGHHRNTGHAWVVLFKQGQEYLFEATQKQGLQAQLKYPLAALMTDYRPRFMFNRDSFWTNTGSSYTTSYGSKAWVRKSRYRPQGAL